MTTNTTLSAYDKLKLENNTLILMLVIFSFFTFFLAIFPKVSSKGCDISFGIKFSGSLKIITGFILFAWSAYRLSDNTGVRLKMGLSLILSLAASITTIVYLFKKDNKDLIKIETYVTPAVLGVFLMYIVFSKS